MAIKIFLLIAFFAVMVGVGFYYRHRVSSVNDFVLGAREVGPWITAFAYGTSYFSAVIFVGYAGQFGWRFGIASTWVGIGNTLLGSLLAWVILGRRTRVMTNHLHSATMPEFFGKRYGSKALKIVASIIVFVFLIPYTASLYNGLSRLFGMAFNIDYEVCVIVMAVLTGLYVVAGGYMATAVNDFIQGIIMLFGIIAVIAAVLSGQGGFMNAMKGLAAVSDPAVSTDFPGVFASFLGPDPLALLGVVILTSLGTWGLPQMVHKFYAIKSEKSISTGTIVSTFFALVVAGGCYFLGGFGRLFSDKIDVSLGYDVIIPTMLSGLPDILIGIVVILVLSASMSTLSSLVLTSSSTLTLDLIKDNVVKNMDDRRQLRVMRVLIVFFILVSVILALVQYRSSVTFIAQMMGISWGALAGAFLAPFLYGLFWKGTTKASVFVCFIVSELFICSNVVLKFMSPINAGAVAMVGSLVLVPLVSLITPKPDKKTVDEIFSCYDQTVVVHQKVSIQEE